VRQRAVIEVVSIFSLTNIFTKNRFTLPLLAFIIPFVVRVIPEILMGPYLIGFDTLGFYVPNTEVWFHGEIDLWGYLSVAPFFYTILMSVVSVGFPLTLALKVISPILLGLLGLSIYIYAKRGLGWSPIKSLAPALLGTLYFLALRISWDMLRNELGLIFLFIALTLLTSKKSGSWKNYVLLSILMLAVVLSHQLVSVIMLGIIGFTVGYRIFRREYLNSVHLVVATLPALFFFLFVYFVTVAPYGFQDYSTTVGSPLATWLGFSSYHSMLFSEGGFFLYCFLPLLPLALLSLKRFAVFQLRIWIILSIILCVIPFAFVSPFRWLIMLLYPLTFLCVDALNFFRRPKYKMLGSGLLQLPIL